MRYCGFSVHGVSALFHELADTPSGEPRAERLRSLGQEEARLTSTSGGNLLRIFYSFGDLCSTLTDMYLGLDMLPRNYEGPWHRLMVKEKLRIVSETAAFTWALSAKITDIPENGDGLNLQDIDAYLEGVRTFNCTQTDEPNRVRVMLTSVVFPPRQILEMPVQDDLRNAGLSFSFDDFFGVYTGICSKISRCLVTRYVSPPGEDPLVVAFELPNEPDYEWLPDEQRIEKSRSPDTQPVNKYITELHGPQIPHFSPPPAYAETTPWGGFQAQRGPWPEASGERVSVLSYDWGPKFDWYVGCFARFAMHLSFAISDQRDRLGRELDVLSGGVTHNNVDFLIRMYRAEPNAFSFCTGLAFHPYHWPDYDIYDHSFKDRQDFSQWRLSTPREFAQKYFKCFDFFKVVRELIDDASGDYAGFAGKSLWLTEFGLGSKLWGAYNETNWEHVPFIRREDMAAERIPRQSVIWEDNWRAFFNQITPSMLKGLDVRGMCFYALRETPRPGLDKHDDDRTNFAFLRRDGFPRIAPEVFDTLRRFMGEFTGRKFLGEPSFTLTPAWTRWKDFSTSLLKSEPWLDVKPPVSVLETLSMLTEEEKTFLYWLTRDYYQGRGAIVDAGCFAGGSTLAMAMGLKRTWPEETYKLDSFDIFLTDDYMREWYFERHNRKTEGNRFRNIFDENICDVREKVRVHDGDISTFPWDGRPVEILFLDVCKAWEINDYCTRSFFPKLIPGHSIVVQQDFFHNWEFWIIITMELFQDRFEYIGYAPWNTAVFRSIAQIEADEVPRELRSLGLPKLAALLERHIERYDDPYLKAMLTTGLARLYQDFNETASAEHAAAAALGLSDHWLVVEALRQMQLYPAKRSSFDAPPSLSEFR